MPRPVEAFPWGSRSMSRICSLLAASAVARLIAVVVLPTPPFWLAMASTRGESGCWSDTMEIADPKDAGVRCCPTGQALGLHVPLCRRCRQFRLCAAALQEQAGSARSEQWRGEGQELWQRSQCSGSHKRRGRKRGGFDTACVYPDGRTGGPGGFTQECRLAHVGFDEIEQDAGSQGQDQAGEAGA